MTSNSFSFLSPADNTTEIKVDTLSIKKAALILRAVNHKLRQIMLKLIADNEKMTVTQIFQHLLLEQSVASQHLAILRKAGFVKTKREGRLIYYSVNKQRFLELNTFISNLLG